MTVTTASGTRFYIGTTAAADTLTEYEADTYVEVGEVESLGEFGDESASVSFTSLGDARVRKSKAARDAGTIALTCGRDPHDDGQNALKAAERTKFEYNIKVVAADNLDANDPPTIYYFRGLVMSARENYGANDNIVRTTFNIGINTEILEIPTEAVA